MIENQILLNCDDFLSLPIQYEHRTHTLCVPKFHSKENFRYVTLTIFELQTKNSVVPVGENYILPMLMNVSRSFRGRNEMI